MNEKLIKRWLEENDRSVAWLARKVDRTRATLGQWLKCGSDIPVSVALKISEVTGLDVRQICPQSAAG